MNPSILSCDKPLDLAASFPTLTFSTSYGLPPVLNIGSGIVGEENKREEEGGLKRLFGYDVDFGFGSGFGVNF